MLKLFLTLLLFPVLALAEDLSLISVEGLSFECPTCRKTDASHCQVQWQGKTLSVLCDSLFEVLLQSADEENSQKYPKNEVVLSNLGLCYLNAQRMDDAIRVLGQSLDLNSENSNAGYFLGLAYFYKQDFTQAASILTNVVKDNPYFAPPYQILSQCMMRLGDMASANTYGSMYRQLNGGR